MTTRIISLKVYEPATIYELPFRVPMELFDQECRLKPGYHTFQAELTDMQLHGMQVWASKNESILKILGVTTVPDNG